MVSSFTTVVTSSKQHNQPVSYYHEERKDNKISNIVVGVTTYDKRMQQSVPAIMSTWGDRFAHIYFFSTTGAANLSISVVPASANHQKEEMVRASMEEVYALYKIYLEHPNAPW